jgi:hypothetical protein
MNKLLKKIELDVDKHGFISINGNINGVWAKALTTLKAYLTEIFNQNKVNNPREKALITILGGKINGHWINIQTPSEIRKKFPQEKEWRIPLDIIQMNIFYFQKISR